MYLIPSFIGESNPELIPETSRNAIDKINLYIVENEKNARRFIKAAGKELNDNIQYFEQNKHTQIDDPTEILEEIFNGNNIGLMSDAGSPAIADPGANIVRLAHSMGIRVIPLVGPSSIHMALMASGLNGQRFSFVGYLPRERGQRINMINKLEKQSAVNRETIIIMEAPHRNQHLADDLIAQCRPQTQLCIAKNITGELEAISTMKIQAWQKNKPVLEKEPALFLILAGK